MPFIGNQPAESYSAFQKQDFTTSATTSYTLDNPVANANELALFINFVRQEPTTSYSASGTTLTLTEATSSSDDMYAIFLGKAIQTVNPPNASVGANQLADNGVTTAKIADDAVTKDKVSNLMYPAFEAYLSVDQTIADDTFTKININTEVFDTDNCYDNSTNYRFTPTVAGKYFVYYNVCGINSGSAATLNTNGAIYKNGSITNSSSLVFNGNQYGGSLMVIKITDFNGSSDYVEFYLKGDVASGSPRADANFSGGTTTFAGAYRIGD